MIKLQNTFYPFDQALSAIALPTHYLPAKS